MGKFCPNLRVVYAIRGERGKECNSYVLLKNLYLYLAVEREKRTEQIVMGTAGTVLDWILKRKVRIPLFAHA